MIGVFFRCLRWHVSTQKSHMMLLWRVLPAVYTGLVYCPGLLSYGPVSGSRWPSWCTGGACCSLTKWPWLFSSRWCGFPFCSGLILGFPLLLFLLLLNCASLCLLLLYGVLFFHLLNDPPVSLTYVLLHYRHFILYIWFCSVVVLCVVLLVYWCTF